MITTAVHFPYYLLLHHIQPIPAIHNEAPNATILYYNSGDRSLSRAFLHRCLVADDNDEHRLSAHGRTPL